MSICSHIFSLHEYTVGILEEISREQHRRSQTHREVNPTFSIKEGYSSFPICSQCSKSSVNGSIIAYKFWENFAMHKINK